MNRITLLLGVLAVLIAGTVGGLFWVQNSARSSLVSLNLGFAAWQLAEPAPIPVLVAASAAGGFLLGGLVFGRMAIRASWRARRAESQLALGAATAWTAPQKADDWATIPKGPAAPTGPTAPPPPTGGSRPPDTSDGWK